MLELKNIKKSYKVGENIQQVLKGIDIKFRKNEFTSILGTSGSGKTTLLNIIGGLDKYDSGDLIIDKISTKEYKDRDWDSYRNYRVGFIFQSYNLIMHQTVLQNVEISLTLSGISKQERKTRAIDALTRVGLQDHIYKKPNQLSGGQMQRVAIARALVNNPEIILADEPTGALDSNTSVQIMDLLKEIAKDKLVIMVTHNPDLAHQYSTRIIELKDGLIINDSNPFDGKEEKIEERTIKKTSMSLSSALSLSFKNLLTKKGRTFITAFAGSIGIIGIALILSLSNGVNKYAKKLEKESMSDYPLTFEKTSYDIFGTIANAFKEEKFECEEGKVCTKDDIVKNSNISADKGTIKKNNIKEFKKYIEEHKEFEENADKIKYTYNLILQVYKDDYTKVNPSTLMKDQTSNIFSELSYKEENYEILEGKLPEEYNEIVLIVKEDNTIDDSLLYSLGIKDKKILNEDLLKFKKDDKYKVESSVVNFDDIMNKTYKLILNTDYYKEENNVFIDYSNDSEYMKNKIDNGIEIKIVGIVKEKNANQSYIGYKQDLIMHIIDETSKTSMYEKQINNKEINVLTNQEFDGIINTYDSVTEQLGIYEKDDPSSISIYPKDYDSKEEIVKLVKKYNEEKEENNEKDLVISYSDLMKDLLGGITKVVNIVSAVLIGFVAISLVVSSIMIGIITYISVLERTKEIGILRAIGASKKDIKRVFRAETMIEGLIAGVLGILITLFISNIINVIVSFTSKINNIASLSIKNAVVLILLSVILNVIAGGKPSRIAAKKDPVEALRTE